MPAKRISRTPDDQESSDFVLKHRIVGAAFLLFFGAMLLPWLLGAPSKANKILDRPAIEISSEENQQSLAKDLQTAIAAEQVPEQEQVYVSKITPLDSNLNRTDTEIGDDNSGTAKVGKAVIESKPEQKISAEKDNSENSTTRSSTTVANNKLQSGSSSESGPDPSQTTKVDVGWVVQVGVFTDKLGAARVVQDLKGKGFKPSTSVVDTNRGKASGTRIWLGPFLQRVEAAKAKTQLTAKTGEAGFIRAYP